LAGVGIIVTSKKRQDLRIRLQKRARRRAEKKVEYLEDDKNWKEVSNIKPHKLYDDPVTTAELYVC